MTFEKGLWEERWIAACTYRYEAVSTPRQMEGCVASLAAENHPEKFDNFALFSPETYKAEVSASIRCAFEGNGCPEIVLTDDCEQDEQGVWRYGACIEVVLYRDGINVWRHYREGQKCFWNQRLGVRFPVEEGAAHELSVRVRPSYLDIAVDGRQMLLRMDDIPEQFHVGCCLCEGVARIYEMNLA